MTTVKFDKAVKYNGVRYAAHEVFRVDDADVAQLKQAGATVLSVESTSTAEQVNDGAAHDEEPKSVEDVAQLKQDLLEYTVAELVKFAEERGIDLQKRTRKAEIYNIIVAALH